MNFFLSEGMAFTELGRRINKELSTHSIPMAALVSGVVELVGRLRKNEVVILDREKLGCGLHVITNMVTEDLAKVSTFFNHTCSLARFQFQMCHIAVSISMKIIILSTSTRFSLSYSRRW